MGKRWDGDMHSVTRLKIRKTNVCKETREGFLNAWWLPKGGSQRLGYFWLHWTVQGRGWERASDMHHNFYCFNALFSWSGGCLLVAEFWKVPELLSSYFSPSVVTQSVLLWEPTSFPVMASFGVSGWLCYRTNLWHYGYFVDGVHIIFSWL